MKKALKFGLLASSAFFASPSWADDREEPRQEEIIVTASGVEQSSSKLAPIVEVIEQERRDPKTQSAVADTLSTVPGVSVSRNGGLGGLTAVRIRGAEGDQTLVLVDGVRVNDPSAPGGAFDFGNLLVGNIDRIEVLRGPNSVPWGSQAIGGVVNVIQAPPTDDWQANARAEYGHRDAKQLVGNVSGTTGVFGISLGGGWFEEEGISAFKGGTERDGYRQYAANGRVKLDLSDSFELDFRGYYVDGRNEIDGFPPPFFGFADTAEFSTYQQLTGYAGANIGLFDDRLKNRLAFTISDINRDNFDAPGQATPSFLSRGRSERFEYQGDADLGVGLRAIFGLEREETGFSDGFSSFKTSVNSGYAQLVAEPVEQITITGGIRLDDHRNYGSEATFAANIVWRPVDGTKISASYGEGFKAPTLFQLNSFFGNVLLQPEKAKNYEIGLEQKLIGDAVTVAVNLFQRDTRDQIDFISCFGQTTGICTNRPFGTYDNVDRTRAQGLEFILNIKPSDRLTIDANYSLIDTEDRATGLALLRRPKHTVNLGVDWQATDWLKVGTTLQMIGDSADVDFQTFGRTSLDGYALAGLRAAVPVNDRIEFYGRVENLFDTDYETVSGYGTYGRNAHVGVRARF